MLTIYAFHNLIFLNTLSFDIVFLNWYIIACAPFYLKFLHDGISEPKHVAVFKILESFLNHIAFFFVNVIRPMNDVLSE